MTFYNGLMFFITLLIALIPAIIMQLKEINVKNYSLFLSCLFIYLAFKEIPIQLLYFLVYLFWEWHLIAIFQLVNKRYKNKIILYHFIIFALLPLIAAKLAGMIGRHWFSFLGISYITFRVLQILIESYDGLIAKSDFLSTINFFIFFPTLSSGPIDRSKRFKIDLSSVMSKKEYVELLGAGLTKILYGMLYKFVLSSISFYFLEKISEQHTLWYLIFYAYLYGMYMFFDFAGYSLMAIGTAYILGVKIPDNFNKPFISKDIKEFWDRWHISLSHWFRDFVFSRYMMRSIRNKTYKSRLNAAAAGFIINMTLMGVWHGLSKDYILYGLYHGILLSSTEVYQKKSKYYKKYKNKPWYGVISWFVTLNFVMFGFLIFSGKFFDVIAILGIQQ